jgi:hypothetical protein
VLTKYYSVDEIRDIKRDGGKADMETVFKVSLATFNRRSYLRNLRISVNGMPIPVSAGSKAVCSRLVVEVVGSNPAEGMNVSLLCLYVVLSCVGRGLCDGLITRPEESYRVCDHRNPERGCVPSWERQENERM